MSEGTISTSFVIRLRVGRDGRRRWWGEAQHVDSGERMAFSDDGKLVQFLHRHLDRLRRIPKSPRR